jgi:hypothetical protein
MLSLLVVNDAIQSETAFHVQIIEVGQVIHAVGVREITNATLMAPFVPIHAPVQRIS